MAPSRKQARAAVNSDAALVQKVMEGYTADKNSHDDFLQKVETRYKAYRAVLELKSKSAAWTSKQHPAYALQVIESLVASLIDASVQFKVRPALRLADPADYARIRDGAEANEILLNQQSQDDRLGAKQTAFARQCLITGLSVWKTYWKYSEGVVPRQTVTQQEVAPGIFIPTLGVTHSSQSIHDDPTAEVVDVRDFIWHQAAISIDKAIRVTHRVLYSMDELRRLEAAGVYKNVDQLVESKSDDTSTYSREQDLFQADRGKDQVTVLEQWRRTETGIRVTTVGNNTVLLADRENPFWHGQFPFIVCSATPDLFRIPGISTTELVADLQDIAWSLLNQRLDNVAMLNNAIVLIADDAEDYDQFEWAPGAQWLVPRPVQETVKTLDVSDMPARVSLESEALIKQDLQNIPGASPALLGQQDQGTNTATEVSLTTSLGQRRIALMKQQFRVTNREIGMHWLKLNQQYVRDKRLVDVVGAKGEAAFREISPLLLQGDFAIPLDAMDESLLRQERQAQAQAALQVALAAAPVFSALSQAGHTPMLNMQAFMDDFLDARDINDKDRYYNPAPAPPLPQQGQSGQGPPQPSQMQQPQNGNGVSAPQAYDANSPSNQFSQSPVGAMQRMGAMAGGPVNTPSG